jgi:energy-coupling factor transporter ATP-binding protein EcfA2
MGAVEDILAWAQTRCPPWRQDALRRLASPSALGAADHDDILNLVKDAVGFAVAAPSNPPVPLDRTHLATATAGPPFHLKAIRNVQGVNRLVPSAGLTFAPHGLTVIYGRNGSGKSGFVRVLRSACRTRIDNPAKLKVLADVYSTTSPPQQADIVIETNGAETVVSWKDGKAASDALLHVAVFDSSAAEIYVDGGNEIQFLPFGLALLHKLNDLCLTLKARLEGERGLVTRQLALSTIRFPQPRQTSVQIFYNALAAETSDAQIEAAAAFTDEDEARLEEVRRVLASDATASADLTAFAVFLEQLAGDCEEISAALSNEKLDECRTVKTEATAARTAANLDAASLFANEPLAGVGEEIWRRLWLAARDYSIGYAYPDKEYPVVSTQDSRANCLLCQQPLGEEASQRLERFQGFLTGALSKTAIDAEAKVETILKRLPALATFQAPEWDARLEQIAARDAVLRSAITDFRSTAEKRRDLLRSILLGSETASSEPLASPCNLATDLRRLAEQLRAEVETIARALTAEERKKLLSEVAELEDRRFLSAAHDKLIERRDLLKEDALFGAAEAELTTTGITRRANELVDEHLTQNVLDCFKDECEALEITHLKIGLARKSGQTKAAFPTQTGTNLTRLASDILSEGEQRALALAAFFTEIAVTDGSGPIVIDDPVSSLDRDRGRRVANRIVAEAANRQTIVFTHDLIFFNDLCRRAQEEDLKTEVVALFSDGANAGKIDPAGVIWKGLSVSKRLGRLRNEFASVRKLHATSPSDYEVQIKNLYGRLRDTYERVVEEIVFNDVIRRGSDQIETQKLRFVHLTDALAIRFHQGMTKANTHSHDNPESETVITPKPDEFEDDLRFIDALINDLKAEGERAEANRPTMKPRK